MPPASSWIVRLPVDSNRFDVVSGELWELGTTGVAEGDDELLAGFDDHSVATTVAERYGGRVDVTDPTSWVATELATVDVGGSTLYLEVGSAFGHGAHPTTRLALDAVAEVVRKRRPTSVLDIGCGTGILGLAAGVLGVERVTGLDIDPDAVDIARRNHDNNARATGRSDITFTVDPIASIERRFDLVVANVLLAEIRPIAAAIEDRVADRLVVTGSLEDQRAELLATFEGLGVVSESHADGWSCFILAR